MIAVFIIVVTLFVIGANMNDRQVRLLRLYNRNSKLQKFFGVTTLHYRRGKNR